MKKNIWIAVLILLVMVFIGATAYGLRYAFKYPDKPNTRLLLELWPNYLVVVICGISIVMVNKKIAQSIKTSYAPIGSPWSEIMERTPTVRENQFEVGQIIKMSPGYYTKNPYYVEVVYYNPTAKEGQVKMTTNIPGHHKLDMRIGNNWEYHYRRMTIVGDKSKHEHQLRNQDLT